MRSVLSVHWKDWCWSWNSNTLATWCKELTHLKRPWYWERLRAGGEGDDRMRRLDGITDSTDMGLGGLAVSDGQGGLACCNPWGRKESDTTEQLNWPELKRSENWGFINQHPVHLSIVFLIHSEMKEPIVLETLLQFFASQHGYRVHVFSDFSWPDRPK